MWTTKKFFWLYNQSMVETPPKGTFPFVAPIEWSLILYRVISNSISNNSGFNEKHTFFWNFTQNLIQISDRHTHLQPYNYPPPKFLFAWRAKTLKLLWTIFWIHIFLMQFILFFVKKHTSKYIDWLSSEMRLSHFEYICLKPDLGEGSAVNG